MGFHRTERRLREAGALARHEARRRSTRLVGHLLCRSGGIPRSRSRPGASCRCGRLRQEAWGKTHRGVSCRQTEPLERRVHVVRREVHVRQGGFLRSGAAETAPTSGPLNPMVRSTREMERLTSPSIGRLPDRDFLLTSFARCEQRGQVVLGEAHLRGRDRRREIQGILRSSSGRRTSVEPTASRRAQRPSL